jgi:hypothetical protein
VRAWDPSAYALDPHTHGDPAEHGHVRAVTQRDEGVGVPRANGRGGEDTRGRGREEGGVAGWRERMRA